MSLDLAETIGSTERKERFKMYRFIRVFDVINRSAYLFYDFNSVSD